MITDSTLDSFTIAAVLAIAAGMYAWYFHCLFLFHDWDRSRAVTDLCRRCGAIRILDTPRAPLKDRAWQIQPASDQKTPEFTPWQRLGCRNSNDLAPPRGLPTPQTCDCPIVFPESPELAGQVHRYDCPNRSTSRRPEREENV